MEGIGRTYIATGARQAFDIIRREEPQILITDIDMPEEDGVALIQQIRQCGIEIRIIVLSGYDRFDYARETFKLGIDDYLLKPVDKDEIKKALGKAILSIEREDLAKAEQQQVKHLKERLSMESSLNGLFTNPSMPEELKEDAYKLLDQIFGPAFLHVWIFLFRKPCQGKLRETMEEYLGNCRIHYYYDHTGNLVILHGSAQPVTIPNLKNQVEELVKRLEDICSTPMIAAISEGESGSRCFPKLYRQAENAAEYILLYSSDKVIAFSDIKNRSTLRAPFNEELNRIRRLFVKSDGEQLSHTIDSLFARDSFFDASIETVRWLYYKVVNILFEILKENGIETDELYFKDFRQFNELNDIRVSLKNLSFELLHIIQEKKKEKGVVNIVVNYVRDHMDRDIDMAFVANLVSMNYYYFSRAFKEAMGMNFTDYILQVRMEEAKKLLTSNSDMIVEISNRVGYANPKHFARAFKNYTGMTPQEYRRKGLVK